MDCNTEDNKSFFYISSHYFIAKYIIFLEIAASVHKNSLFLSVILVYIVCPNQIGIFVQKLATLVSWHSLDDGDGVQQ
jgi:uncharacterized membrane protein